LIELAEKAKNLEKQLFEATEENAKLQKQMSEVTEENAKLRMELDVAQEVNAELQSERDVAVNEAVRQAPVTEVNESQLQSLVEKLVESALQKMLPTMQQQAPIVELKPQQSKAEDVVDQQPEAKPVAPEKDWESVPSEELKASKARGAADEKIRRSFLAIATHNDHKAKDVNGNPDPSQQWFIGNQALRQLSGCNGQLVADWMGRHRLAIDDHNSKYGLGQYHNKRHKQSISEAVSW
jgi:regulator of replication initiation timing